MLLYEALFSYLTTAPRETAAAIGARFYPNIAPMESVLPCISYQQISAPARWIAHDGPAGLARVLIQFTVMARNYKSAAEIAGAVRRDIDGFKGIMGGVGGVEIRRMHVENEINDNELTDADVMRLDASVIFLEV